MWIYINIIRKFLFWVIALFSFILFILWIIDSSESLKLIFGDFRLPFFLLARQVNFYILKITSLLFIWFVDSGPLAFFTFLVVSPLALFLVVILVNNCHFFNFKNIVLLLNRSVFVILVIQGLFQNFFIAATKSWIAHLSNFYVKELDKLRVFRDSYEMGAAGLREDEIILQVLMLLARLEKMSSSFISSCANKSVESNLIDERDYIEMFLSLGKISLSHLNNRLGGLIEFNDATMLAISIVLIVCWYINSFFGSSVEIKQKDLNFLSYFYLLGFLVIINVASQNFLIFFLSWKLISFFTFLLINFWLQGVKNNIILIILTLIGDLCLISTITLIYRYVEPTDFNTMVNHMWVLECSENAIFNISMLKIINVLLLLSFFLKFVELFFYMCQILNIKKNMYTHTLVFFLSWFSGVYYFVSIMKFWFIFNNSFIVLKLLILIISVVVVLLIFKALCEFFFLEKKISSRWSKVIPGWWYTGFFVKINLKEVPILMLPIRESHKLITSGAPRKGQNR